MGLISRLLGRRPKDSSEFAVGSPSSIGTPAGQAPVQITTPDGQQTSVQVTTNMGQPMGIKDALGLAHDLQAALKTAMESGNMTVVSGSGVIDARTNPELRKQIMDALAGHGVDVSAFQAAAANAAAGVPGATPAHAEDLLLSQLSKLGELKEAGVLTQAEVDAQKAKLLKRPGA